MPVFSSQYPEKGEPNANDKILIADSENSNAIASITVEQLNDMIREAAVEQAHKLMYFEHEEEYTLGPTNPDMGGYVTGSALNLVFEIPLPKYVPDGWEIEIKTLWANCRIPAGGYWAIGGFVSGGYNLIGANGVTLGSILLTSPNSLYVTVVRSSAFTTNNTPVSLAIADLKIKFIDPLA